MERSTNRRQFLEVAAASLVAASTVKRAKPDSVPSGSKLSVGLIGCGGRGKYLAGVFSETSRAEITYLADVDSERLSEAASEYNAAKPVADFRQILADPTVNAVIVATPDHWHSPAAIMGCDAGKHVYVEKPCSHNVREGRMLVEAARRNKSIVQHGTQVRSTGMVQQAVKLLRDGIIGDVIASKAWNIQLRRSIGHSNPGDPPQKLDYDSWVGPAAMLPYQENRVHDGWHWWYHFGTGDMGNDGVHDVDYARWGLGIETHPRAINAVGGKYFFDDDQEFPDTQQVTFEYDSDDAPLGKKMLIYEQRLWSTNYPNNVDSGAEFYGTAGRMFLSRRGKVQILGEHNKRIDMEIPAQSQDAESHVANFIDCVQAGKPPNGEIEIGHLTTTLCHLGNLATRVQRTLQFDPASESILDDQEANDLLGREYRDHWGTPRRA